jgi:hypothetical protein
LPFSQEKNGDFYAQLSNTSFQFKPDGDHTAGVAQKPMQREDIAGIFENCWL